MTNAAKHRAILDTLHDIYVRKNADYGDSFAKSVQEFGLTAALVRMSDKLERAKRLAKAETQVKDESLRDTLLDLANYAVMTIMAFDSQHTQQQMSVRVWYADKFWELRGLDPSVACGLTDLLDELGVMFSAEEQEG